MEFAKRYAPFLVLFAAMLWATDAPFRIHLTEGLASNFIVLGEHFVSVIFVLPVLIMNLSELKKLGWKEWLSVIFIAICGSALASVAFTESFHYVNPSVAILLQKLQPFIAIGLSAILLKEVLSPRFWTYTAIAMVGAYLVSFPGLVPQTYPGEAWHANLIGVTLAVVAAAFWGASTVFGKLVLNRTNFKVMTSLRFTLAFLFLIVLNAVAKTYPPLSSITPTDYLFIVIIALTSGVVSLFIYYKGLENTRASVATIAELGFPLAAVVVNWIFLGDALAPMQIVGMLVILAAVAGLTRYNRDIEVEPLPEQVPI